MICDMSSDIFSREIDVSKFALIYAGAQKNLGPAGTTLYIVNSQLLGNTGRNIPSMLDLQVHIDNDSMYNTPPVFAVYTSMLMLEWIKNLGGVKVIEAMNEKKANLLYHEIDHNPCFKGTANQEDRSLMNATFVCNSTDHKEGLDKMLQYAGITDLKGHRSVGGYRASMYNALPLESVEVLVEVMRNYAITHV
jgi:phosphoserine aminotransferase